MSGEVTFRNSEEKNPFDQGQNTGTFGAGSGETIVTRTKEDPIGERALVPEFYDDASSSAEEPVGEMFGIGSSSGEEDDTSLARKGFLSTIRYVVSSPLRWIAHFFYWVSMPSKKSLEYFPELIIWAEQGYCDSTQEPLVPGDLKSDPSKIDVEARVYEDPSSIVAIWQNMQREKEIRPIFEKMTKEHFIKIGERYEILMQITQGKKPSWFSRVFPQYALFLKGKNAVQTLHKKFFSNNPIQLKGHDIYLISIIQNVLPIHKT